MMSYSCVRREREEGIICTFMAGAMVDCLEVDVLV